MSVLGPMLAKQIEEYLRMLLVGQHVCDCTLYLTPRMKISVCWGACAFNHHVVQPLAI